MMEPRVSVIMPCYKNEASIPRAVASVQAQDEPRWELIAVDDGSPGRDAEVLEGIAQSELRLRVLRQANQGVSAARNAGLRAARGEWAFFLDADDYLAPDALSRLLTAATEGADIVCGAYRLLSRVTGEETLSRCADGDRQTVLESLIRGDSALNSMCARLYLLSFLRENGIEAPQGVAVGEDVLFNLRAFLAARAYRILPDVVYTYDYGGDSAMTRARRDVYEKSLPMLEGIGAFLTENGLETTLFRAHIDIWLRTLRADRGRMKAALAFGRDVVRRIERGVSWRGLPGKQQLYYWALRLCPLTNVLLP